MESPQIIFRHGAAFHYYNKFWMFLISDKCLSRIKNFLSLKFKSIQNLLRPYFCIIFAICLSIISFTEHFLHNIVGSSSQFAYYFSHVSVGKGIQLGVENNQRVGVSPKIFKISLSSIPGYETSGDFNRIEISLFTAVVDA